MDVERGPGVTIERPTGEHLPSRRGIGVAASFRAPSIVYRLRRWARLSRAGRAIARVRDARRSPRRVARHTAAASALDPSHAFEWPYLRSLLERLDLLEGGFAVDLAAGDGVTSSCTLPLFRDQGWAGLAIECDASRAALWRHACGGFERVSLAVRRVTPDNVRAVLTDHDVGPEPTLLNLDIDSYDFDVAAAILSSYRPLVIDMEINEKIPPPIRFAVRYPPAFEWDEGHCYGCSLQSAFDLVVPFGYRLEGLACNNAFFVREDVAVAHSVAGLEPDVAYRAGYLARPDRLQLFPWNADMDDLLRLEPAEAVAHIRRRFRARAAHFDLGLEPLRAVDSRRVVVD